MPLINCEVFLALTWSENCVLTYVTTEAADPDADPAIPALNTPTIVTFQITDTKLYVPTVTLSTENDKKLLEQLKTGFKKTIKWNKYRLQITNQTQNNNLNYLIDPTFTNSIDFLSYRLKMKTIEQLFQSIMYQTFQWKILIY